MINRIKALSKAYSEEFIQVRRHLHAHPELSFEEWNTSIYIQEKLKNWDIPFEVLANTGVCGIIEGKNPNSRTVALRADMDALPIEEENQVEYKSTNKGIMHACGHDVHTTCLLGAAKILAETKGEARTSLKSHDARSA
jgi:hippurate hydrolase